MIRGALGCCMLLEAVEIADSISSFASGDLSFGIRERTDQFHIVRELGLCVEPSCSC